MIRLLLYSLLVMASCGGQPFSAQSVSPTSHPAFPVERVKASLATHRESTLTDRRFKQEDITPLLQRLPGSFTVDTAGYSVEGRPLYRAAWGRGTTQVLLWSQMHGDEPTATAALFDLFSWLNAAEDGLDDVRHTIRDSLHLTFLPMLNPDGAARYQRRNALGIDLNRDALHLSSPEARLLKGERDRLEAAWGFNLHDQSPYYSAGFPGGRGAVLSILAPAFDWEKTMSAKREDATQLIALMNELWQQEMPGQIGRYNDDFEPRAFGDNLQKWGTRTILIESGGYAGDPEKQEIRRLNLLALIGGLYGIATGSYEDYSVEQYWQIPENKSNGMHDLILENAAVTVGGELYRMDIGFRRSEQSLSPDYRKYVSRAYVSDLGDLHTFGAFQRFDVAGKQVTPGKVYPGKLSVEQIAALDATDLYRGGYTTVRATTPPPYPAGITKKYRVIHGSATPPTEIAYGAQNDVVVWEGSRVVALVVNGQLIEID